MASEDGLHEYVSIPWPHEHILNSSSVWNESSLFNDSGTRFVLNGLVLDVPSCVAAYRFYEEHKFYDMQKITLGQ